MIDLCGELRPNQTLPLEFTGAKNLNFESKIKILNRIENFDYELKFRVKKRNQNSVLKI